jgi:hypothetical protein
MRVAHTLLQELLLSRKIQIPSIAYKRECEQIFVLQTKFDQNLLSLFNVETRQTKKYEKTNLITQHFRKKRNIVLPDFNELNIFDGEIIEYKMPK